jgi:NAD(P)H dehydrogenase (quinone)
LAFYQGVFTMAKVAVVFHSGYGHTQRLAQSVAEGAGADLITIDADGNVPETAWDTLAAADAIIFGSPTYMGMVSWQFKKFADASSKPWYVQAWKDKIFGGFTNSANVDGDKHSTLHYMMTLAMQHGGLWAGTGMAYNNHKGSLRADINYMASNAGPVAQTPGDASASEMNAGDLETGRKYGERIAALAAKRG